MQLIGIGGGLVSNKTKVKLARMFIKHKLKSVPVFGRFLRFASILTCLASIIAGLLAFIPFLGQGKWYFGIYLIIMGILVGLFELPMGFIKDVAVVGDIWKNFALRSLIHFAASVLCFFVPVGIPIGIACIFVGFLYLFSWVRFEEAEENQSYEDYIALFNKATGRSNGDEDEEVIED